jgi:dienelactone hydrolase
VRPFEWLLVGLLAARLIAILLRGESGMRWRLLTAIGVGGALIAHLAWEGPRWTMAPSYLVATIVVLLIAYERPHPKAVMLRMGRNRRLRRPVPWGRAIASLVVWAPTLALSWALPVWAPPEPTGAWAVGSLSFPLALPDAPGPDGASEAPRRTMARMWYPVDPALALPHDAPWVERGDVVLRALARSAGLPSFVFSHLRLVPTHAAWAAPLAPPPDPAGWPVVTFDHGLGGFRSQNTFLAEDLASHGAVVVAIDHPGDALGTTLPDGTTLPYAGLPPAAAPGYAGAVVALGARWQHDTLALLGMLADLAPVGDLAGFAGALDLERVVTAGHSTGGGVAVEVCLAWTGCRATLALDPWWAPVHPNRLADGTEKPVLVIASDPELGYFASANDDRFVRFAAASGAEVRLLVLEGGGHHDVNDTALLSPLAARFGHHVGPVAKEDAMAAVRAVALALLAGATPDELAAAPPEPLRATPAPRRPVPAPPAPRLPPPEP